MCEPASISAATTWMAANAGTIATVASGAVSAYSAYNQGQVAEDTAKYNARQMDNEATKVRNKSVQEENEHRRKVAELVSRQRAQFGAMGVDVNAGSAFQLQRDAEILGEADALRIRTSFEDRASSLNTQAELTRDRGEDMARAGKLKAGATLLGTAGSVMGGGIADKWFKPNSAAKVAKSGNLKFYNTSVNLPATGF